VYNSGGECGRASKSKRDASGYVIACGEARVSETTSQAHEMLRAKRGAHSVTAPKTIPLQQS